MPFRLIHTKRQAFGSNFIHHAWVGQTRNSSDEVWEDRTNEYDTSKDAELALYKNVFAVNWAPTLEH